MTTPTSGPTWWYAFLKERKVQHIRTFFALGCRESNANPSCLYPAGAPWGDWEHGNGRHFDTGVLQCNDVHLDTLRSIYGPSVDMRIMLDPAKCLEYSIRLSKNGFADWGLKVAPDESSYSFDWSAYPASWRTQYAADSEAGFTTWWNAYPAYVKAAGGPAIPVPPVVPKPTPKPAPKPAVPTGRVVLADVAYGKSNTSIKVVQIALNGVVRAGLVADGQFGPKTQAAYDTFRRNILGWHGPDAAGAPGLTSLTALGKQAHFTVIA